MYCTRGSGWRLRAIGVTVVMLVTAVSIASAETTYYVATCGDDSWTGTSSVCQPPDGPKATIQAAIDTATHGDEIEVLPGTYNEYIDLLGKAIWLRSSDGPEVTIIDATGLHNPVVCCTSGEGLDTVFDGFTATGGYTWLVGGGMYIGGSSPTVMNCTFIANTASMEGGGMYIGGSSPRVMNCKFIANYAATSGGGMFNDYPGSPTVTDCLFVENTAHSNGGGMCNRDYSAPIIRNCTFDRNSANGSGGGICNDVYAADGFFSAGGTAVINCTFTANTAALSGGGMCNASWGSSGSLSVTVTNCTFSGNTATTGGGMSNWGTSTTVTNCVLWGDTPDELTFDRPAPAVTYCDVQGGIGEPWFGQGCIDADPLFVDPTNGDFRPSAGSPCIDAGHNWGLPVDAGDFDQDGNTCELFPLDLDGLPRFVDDPSLANTGCGLPVVVDIGAYEFQDGGTPAEVVFADMNGDGVVDVLDLLEVLMTWGPVSGCALADCDMSGEVEVHDLLELLAAWGPCP